MIDMLCRFKIVLTCYNVKIITFMVEDYP